MTPAVLAFLLLMGTAGLVWWQPMPTPGALASPSLTEAPLQVGAWQGKVLGVEARAVEILETDDVALVEYTRGQEPPVWLAQVGGFGNRAAFHPPELCYVGSHYEVEGRGVLAVSAQGAWRRVMQLRIRQGEQRFEAWYWFTVGSRMTPHYYEQQRWLLGQALRGQPMAGTLVRISTPLDTPEAVQARLTAFLDAWEQR
jgi:EpsI family protein